jgi:ubiquinone/menaquinone biosynthesis C-methylase UbiE
VTSDARTARRRRTDRWWSVASPGYDRLVGVVGWHRWQGSLVADVSSGSVLDVGCGPAHLAGALAGRGVRYVGVDRSTGMLRRARRSGRGTRPRRPHLVRADVEALPFPDECFDVVVSTGVLGLLDLRARRTALSELVRVSKGDVRLLEPVSRRDHHVGPLRWRLLAFVHARPLDPEELDAVGLTERREGPPRFFGTYTPVRASRVRPTFDGGS